MPISPMIEYLPECHEPCFPPRHDGQVDVTVNGFTFPVDALNMEVRTKDLPGGRRSQVIMRWMPPWSNNCTEKDQGYGQ